MDVNKIIKNISKKKEEQVRENLSSDDKLQNLYLELYKLSVDMNNELKIVQALESYGLRDSKGKHLQTKCVSYEYFNACEYYYRYYICSTYIFLDPKTLSLWATDRDGTHYISPSAYDIEAFIKAYKRWSEQLHNILKEEGLE